LEDVDFFEINEAFASQAVMSVQHLGIGEEKVSIVSFSCPHFVGFSSLWFVSCVELRLSLSSSSSLMTSHTYSTFRRLTSTEAPSPSATPSVALALVKSPLAFQSRSRLVDAYS
jgi:hypothetical protein